LTAGVASLRKPLAGGSPAGKVQPRIECPFEAGAGASGFAEQRSDRAQTRHCSSGLKPRRKAGTRTEGD